MLSSHVQTFFKTTVRLEATHFPPSTAVVVNEMFAALRMSISGGICWDNSNAFNFLITSPPWWVDPVMGKERHKFTRYMIDSQSRW